MKIPLDFRELHRPVKEKYLDEETPEFARWMEFGVHPSGAVDIVEFHTARDIFVAVPQERAAAILAARDAFCDAIIKAVNGP